MCVSALFAEPGTVRGWRRDSSADAHGAGSICLLLQVIQPWLPLVCSRRTHLNECICLPPLMRQISLPNLLFAPYKTTTSFKGGTNAEFAPQVRGAVATLSTIISLSLCS